MTVLRDLSFAWSMIHVFAMFLLLFEPRYSWKTTIITYGLTCIILSAANALIVSTCEVTLMGIAFFSCTIPSMIVLFILSKYRDGRFFFLFCMSDTLCFWILQITNLLDRLSGSTYVTMFITRLVMFPLVEWVFWRYLRKSYLELQSRLDRGWWLFAVVGFIYYILIMVASIPVGTPIPDAVSLLRILLIMALMPLTYFTILRSLWRQMQTYESSLREEEARQSAQMYAIQVDAMRLQAGTIQKSEQELALLRHDMRHAISGALSLAGTGANDEAQKFLQSFDQAIQETSPRRRCENQTLNAILNYHLSNAEAKGIEVTEDLDIPENLELDVVELSTVFANAIENAVNACLLQPEGEPRRLELTARTRPQFVLEIANTFSGEVSFDEKGLPLSSRTGHGIGTRSIAAYAEKHSAYLEYRAENGVFRLRMLLTLPSEERPDN